MFGSMKDIDKSIVKEGIDRAMGEFTDRVKELGFERTKKWFWVKSNEECAEFIHVHLDGISYGSPISYSVSFRVHCGVRNYEDEFESLALNGPCSSDSQYREDKYHHRFNTKSGSTYQRCLDDLIRFVCEVGKPWFKISTAAVERKSENLELKQKSLKLLGLKKRAK